MIVPKPESRIMPEDLVEEMKSIIKKMEEKEKRGAGKFSRIKRWWAHYI
jgi:hypothetical protein